MSYAIIVPNAGQSPGLFPAQNNANFNRLKTIINSDHVFNDTAQADDGIHRQVTLVNRSAAPVGLVTGANAMLYSFPDSNSATQLYWYDGATIQQLTPYQFLLPIRIVDTRAFAGNETFTIYADPGFRYCGTAWAMITNSIIFRFYNILRSDTNDIHELDSNSGSSSRPTLSFSGNALQITNNDSNPQTLTWSLIINRIS